MMQRQFHGVGLVWNILRRYLPEHVSNGIKGMRCLASQMGCVFDVEEQHVKELQTIFEDKNGKTDFEVTKCEQLPELFEGDKGPARNGFGGGGGYGGNRGGGGSFGGGGGRFGGGGGGGYHQ